MSPSPSRSISSYKMLYNLLKSQLCSRSDLVTPHYPCQGLVKVPDLVAETGIIRTLQSGSEGPWLLAGLASFSDVLALKINQVELFLL